MPLISTWDTTLDPAAQEVLSCHVSQEYTNGLTDGQHFAPLDVQANKTRTNSSCPPTCVRVHTREGHDHEVTLKAHVPRIYCMSSCHHSAGHDVLVKPIAPCRMNRHMLSGVGVFQVRAYCVMTVIEASAKEQLSVNPSSPWGSDVDLLAHEDNHR